MRISDCSSDVCSSDLISGEAGLGVRHPAADRWSQGSDRRRAHSPWQDVFRRQRRNATPPPDQPGCIGTRTREGRNSRARSRLLVQLRSAMKIEKMTLRFKIGRAHVSTPVTNAHLVCRLLIAKKKKNRKTRHKT